MLAPQQTHYWVDTLTQYGEYWRFLGQLQLVPVYTALIQQTQAAVKTHSLAPANICTGSLAYPPARDALGNNLTFTKPILLLTDNFSGSAAEFFSATLQDNGRAFVYGTRTDGAGGARLGFVGLATPYSEGSTIATDSLGIRIKNIHAPGLPAAPLIENIGVLPDVVADFQTKDNLLIGGANVHAGIRGDCY